MLKIKRRVIGAIDADGIGGTRWNGIGAIQIYGGPTPTGPAILQCVGINDFVGLSQGRPSQKNQRQDLKDLDSSPHFDKPTLLFYTIVMPTQLDSHSVFACFRGCQIGIMPVN
jgi:hypothetical protein